ncbi:MAG: tripartite tricarboxylate transporter substrate binding protein BugD [Reyranella sp.]|uniref:Bug family tripartite tricarboxylate transporter substrate binding protein n=1 Tax=Reyranella sp. TaxID=1929291 RepID=UPI001AC6DEBB|nr:tripartite tricarboxylate transporter substrate-binding protein [Reyranella sp.]MBN9087470.1 tripartite tricarboxylate transporter substrate binding protein BugD [Reyranella sp.]
MNPRRLFLGAITCVAFLAPAASAETWPTRPVSMIVPASAGGPTDAIARVLAEPMAARLGQTVVIDNVAGAGGTIGVGKLARATPDGYTLGIGQWSHYVLNGATYTLQYDLLKDFAPIQLLTNGPLLLVARKTLPADDLKSLIAWLKANADKASAGTGGVGAPGHISGIFFQKQTGTSFAFVPYRGTGPALRDLMAGQIDLMIDQASNVVPQIQAGTIKAFAVLSPQRLASTPNVPTVDEAGLAGFLSVWHGLWAPRAVPADVIAKVNAAAAASLADPKTREKLAALGQEVPPPGQQNPQALAAFQKAEIEKWWPIVKAAGIKGE